jgi:hypothetical protein
MVGSGYPESLIALHPLISGKSVLESMVQCMTHMKLSCDVRRRHNDGERLLVRIDLRSEAALLFPGLIDTILEILGIISFC